MLKIGPLLQGFIGIQLPFLELNLHLEHTFASFHFIHQLLHCISYHHKFQPIHFAHQPKCHKIGK
jgi:hypothetical protein